FVARLGQRPIAIGTLADPPAAIAAFDDDRASVAARVAAMKAAGGGTLGLHAAARAARAPRRARSRLSAPLLLLGARGVPGRRPPGALRPPILDSGAVVHAIVNRSTAATAIAGPMDAVRRLADQTHGQFTPIYSAASYQVALDRLADRLASEMVVEYIVPPRSAATDIQVGVRIPGAGVRGLGVRPR